MTEGRPALVLIISDQEWSIRSLDSILGPAGYAVLRAYTGNSGLEQARRAQPDLVIADLNLPDINGLSVSLKLRQDGVVTPSTPIVLMTSGHTSRQQRLAAMRAGAWDLLGHPLDAEELLLRFEAYMRAKQDADTARLAGLVDEITGLYNLAGLSRRARELAATAARSHAPLACVVLGQGTMGEVEGAPIDEATIRQAAMQVARVLREHGRGSDAIGRVGEGEFAVFAASTDQAGAELLAKRIRQTLETEGFGGAAEGLRAGFEAVADMTEAGVEPVDLLHRATAALRSARQRRDSWVSSFMAGSPTVN